MNSLSELLNPTFLIHTVGLLGVLAIIFAESGLLIGFFLPGDSLLFTAGFLASAGYLSFPLLFVGSIIAAIAGDSLGYAIGKKIGPKLFTREDSFFFKQRYAEQAELFFEKKGGQAIFLARFVPIIRTFVPVVAGVGLMKYRRFLRFNIAGALCWAGGISALGYFLGKTIPNIDKYLLPIIIIIIVISILPGVIELYKQRKSH